MLKLNHKLFDKNTRFYVKILIETARLNHSISKSSESLIIKINVSLF